MMILLTNQCQGECSHCFEDSHMGETHMEEDVFLKALSFLKMASPAFLQVSGGEFTLHPNFFNMVKKLTEELPITNIILQSNGLYLLDDENIKNKVLELLKLEKVKGLQIRAIEKYYPRFKDIKDNEEKLKSLHEKILVATDPLQGSIFPLGRGKNLKEDHSPDKSPLCTKLFINKIQFRTKSLLEFLAKHQILTMAFCSPTITTNGDITAGETRFCKVIGNVENSESEFMQNLMAFQPCGKCGVSLTKRKPIKEIKDLLNE